MGLDMFLTLNQKYYGIDWALPYTEDDHFFFRYVSITRADGSRKAIPQYEVNSIQLANGLWTTHIRNILNITPTTITFTFYNTAIEGIEERTIKKSEITGINYNYAYWRKANQVHNWFCNNIEGGVENGERYLITGYQLLDLKSACYKVLNNRECAISTLPPKDGYFFSKTKDNSINELYFEDLEDTISQLDGIYSDEIFYYRSSY